MPACRAVANVKLGGASASLDEHADEINETDRESQLSAGPMWALLCGRVSARPHAFHRH